MKKESISYGNWISNKRLFLLFFLSLICIIPSFFPLHCIIKIMLWIFSVIFTCIFLVILHFYHMFSKNNGELQHKIRNIVLDKLNWDGIGFALDIGTGSGALAINLAKKLPNSSVRAIDYWGKTWSYSKEMCENNARLEGVGKRIIFQRADASQLPFEDEEFDAVISSFVFHEIKSIKNKINLIKEALRVLKKNGAFSFMDTFKNKRTYGNLEELKSNLFNLHLKEVEFIEVNNEIKLGQILRLAFKNSALFYGIK